MLGAIGGACSCCLTSVLSMDDVALYPCVCRCSVTEKRSLSQVIKQQWVHVRHDDAAVVRQDDAEFGTNTYSKNCIASCAIKEIDRHR